MKEQLQAIKASVETALNSSGDVMFAATAEYMEWRKQGKPLYFTEKQKKAVLASAENKVAIEVEEKQTND